MSWVMRSFLGRIRYFLGSISAFCKNTMTGSVHKAAPNHKCFFEIIGSELKLNREPELGEFLFVLLEKHQKRLKHSEICRRSNSEMI